jgi:RimJ/RimL family protein N-acetyltransferase
MDKEVALHPWTVDDLPVLQRSNTPEMTAFLGGPEPTEQLEKRHANFLRLWEEGEASMFTIAVESEAVRVGSVGYWKRTWNDTDVFEAGWSVATQFQGRGIAARALDACLHHAAEHGERDEMLAFPRIDNAPSNALCRTVGFHQRGEADFEYPKGNPIRVNVWAFDLATLR